MSVRSSPIHPSIHQDSESDESKAPGGGSGSGGGSGGGGGGGDPSLDPDPDANSALGLGLESEEVDFPPTRLLGPASDSTAQPTFAGSGSGSGAKRREEGGDGGEEGWREIHPVVARRGLDFLWYLCKTSFRVTYDMLTVGPADGGGGELSSPGGGKGKERGGGGGRVGGGSGKGKGKLIEAMDVAGGTCSWVTGVGLLVAKGGGRGLLYWFRVWSIVKRYFLFLCRTNDISYHTPQQYFHLNQVKNVCVRYLGVLSHPARKGTHGGVESSHRTYGMTCLSSGFRFFCRMTPARFPLFHPQLRSSSNLKTTKYFS